MNPQLNSQQVMLVLGTALAIGGVMVLVIFGLIRSLRKQKKEMNMSAAIPPAADDSVFLISSLQGVVASLKAREKELEALLREAETRADVNQKIMETVLAATPQGLMIFDAAGTLTIANQAVKNMLKLDTWARRRYSDIFASETALASSIQDCLANPTRTQPSRAKYAPPEGGARAFDVSILPYLGRGGQIAGVVCIFTLSPTQRAP